MYVEIINKQHQIPDRPNAKYEESEAEGPKNEDNRRGVCLVACCGITCLSGYCTECVEPSYYVAVVVDVALSVTGQERADQKEKAGSLFVVARCYAVENRENVEAEGQTHQTSRKRRNGGRRDQMQRRSTRPKDEDRECVCFVSMKNNLP